jgi:cytochrome P450
MSPPAPATLHPFDPGVLADPWDYYRRVREEAPVWREPNTGIFLISSHAAAARVLRDWEGFSNRFARAMGGLGEPPPEVLEVARRGYPPVDTMLTADPPEQRRFRKLVNKAFSAKRVDALEGRIEEIAHELVDRMRAAGAPSSSPSSRSRFRSP